MPWGAPAVPGRPSRGRAYPIAVLLSTALLAGCADTRTPAPTFDRPAAAPSTAPSGATPPPGTGTTPGPTPTSAAPTGQASGRSGPRYVFPVRSGKASYHPTHSAYPATDIFADCGTPVVAVTSGRILEVSRVDRYRKSGPQGPLNGGKAVSLLGDDGVRYYGSHLDTVRGDIEPGVRVRAGQQLGTVGRTGNANNVCHLHFGISPPCRQTGDWWIRRGVVWPARFLDAWRKKRDTSPAAQVQRWHADRGCPAAP